MLAHLRKSVSVKNIGLWLSDEEISLPDQSPLLQKPVLSLNKFLPSDGNWYRWTGHFYANGSSSFLLIGNFYNDEDSQIKMPSRSDLRFGYYYVDDVRLFKIPPILTVPDEISPFATYIPKPGEIITLGRIYFDHDRADFMPRALLQLSHLLDFLEKYPRMHIEIIGHTDMVGSTDYNTLLSQRRALAVLTWLTLKGISPNRLSSRGMGNAQPIGSNNTHQGRSQNRRVEIKVISI
jgi:outer membrane protein OmpA-like peptidoglycan-associated protein